MPEDGSIHHHLTIQEHDEEKDTENVQLATENSASQDKGTSAAAQLQLPVIPEQVEDEEAPVDHSAFILCHKLTEHDRSEIEIL